MDKSIIGIAHGTPKKSRDEIVDILQVITNKKPEVKKMADLAGPNDTLHILMSADSWCLLLALAIGIYGKTFIKEVAKSHWKRLFDARVDPNSELGSLSKIVKDTKEQNVSVIFGLSKWIKKGRYYHVGIELNEGSPEEIARVVGIFSKYGQRIEDRLEDWEDFSTKTGAILMRYENSDCSLKLNISKNGRIFLKFKLPDSSEEFDFNLVKQ